MQSTLFWPAFLTLSGNSGHSPSCIVHARACSCVDLCMYVVLKIQLFVAWCAQTVTFNYMTNTKVRVYYEIFNSCLPLTSCQCILKHVITQVVIIHCLALDSKSFRGANYRTQFLSQLYVSTATSLNISRHYETTIKNWIATQNKFSGKKIIQYWIL